MITIIVCLLFVITLLVARLITLTNRLKSIAAYSSTWYNDSKMVVINRMTEGL